MRPDVYFDYAHACLWIAVLATYGVRLVTRGGFRSERVAQFGDSVLINRSIMDMAYWMIEPVVRGFARLGVTPNALTWSALVLGIGAGVAIAVNWFALACLLAMMSTFGDILDGQVARLTNSGSNSGELLDAAVDRYTEFAMFAGLVIVWRDSVWQICIGLSAMLASYMISYATAKAEALGVKPPRGLMRRHERSTYVIIGFGLVPLVGPTCVDHDLPYSTMALIATAIVGVVGNLAGIVRFVRIGRALR